MNTSNNFRRRQSQDRIQKAFVSLAQQKDFRTITVKETCTLAKVNRSTFYANYLDIFDLADTIRGNLEKNYINWNQFEINAQSTDLSFLYLFKDIYANQLLYKAYFNLGGALSSDLEALEVRQLKTRYGENMGRYHAAFFRAGITQIIKMWLASDCLETPEAMYTFIQTKIGEN